MLDHNCCLATLLEFLILIQWAQEAESHKDVVLALDILLSEDTWPIQVFMAVYVEIGSPNQVIVKSLKLGLQRLTLPNSRLSNIREYSLWRNSSNTSVDECCLP